MASRTKEDFRNAHIDTKGYVDFGRNESPPQKAYVPSLENGYYVANPPNYYVANPPNYVPHPVLDVLDPWDTQVGGDHYTKLKIQPLEYALANNLGIMEHAVIKYTTRHESKGGAVDIRKGIDYLIKILKHKYNEDY